MRKLKSLFMRILRSKDGKVLASNFAYLSSLQIASYIFPLISIPYLARVLGVDGLGKISFAAAIIIWIQTIADWGFDMTGARNVAQTRDDRKEVSKIFSDIFWSRIFLMFCSFLVLLLLLLIVPKFRENYVIILFTFLYVPGHILFPAWFFLGLERMKYSTILNVISKLIFIVAIFIFIKDKDDYILQPVLVASGYFLSGIIALYFIFVKWKYRLYKPVFRTIIFTIKGSTDVFINTLMPNLYNNLSVLLLGFFGGDTANGIYYAGRKFGQVAYSVLNTLTNVFFPYLSRKIEYHSLYAKFNLGVSGLGSLILFVFAPLLIRLFFGEGYGDAIIVLRITAFALLFTNMDSVYGQNYLIVLHREKLLRNLTIVASVCGFVIAFPLIYYFSYIGASITYMVSSFLIGVLPMYYALKIKRTTCV